MVTYSLHDSIGLLILALVLEIVVSHTVSDCTVLDNLPCAATYYEEQDCLTHPPDSGYLKPAAPDNVIVSTNKTDINRYRLTVSWGPPKDGSIRDLRGFDLALYNRNAGGIHGCVWFDLRQANWSNGDAGKVRYNYTFYMDGGSKMEANVYSLPRNANSANVIRKVVSIPRDIPVSSQWRTELVSFDDNDGNISFSFKLAPEAFGFTGYRVFLHNCSGADCSRHRVPVLPNFVNQGQDGEVANLSYNNFIPGRYEIWVIPEGGDELSVPRRSKFSIEVKTPEESNKTGTVIDPESTLSQGTIIFPVVMVVFVIMTLVFGKLVTYAVPCWPCKKTVIIVSSYDVEGHKKVLEELTAYLKSLGCHVRVFVGTTRPRGWQLRLADDVLMMCCNMKIQKQVSAIDKDEPEYTVFKDAFLHTYAYVKGSHIIERNGKPKFCLLYFPYMPYPEVKLQLPKITDHDLWELERFIFSDALDENGDINMERAKKHLKDPTRFYKISLAIEAVLNERDPADMAESSCAAGLVNAGTSCGPGSTVSWSSKAPSDINPIFGPW